MANAWLSQTLNDPFLQSSAAQIGIEIIHFLATDSTTDTNKAARNISSAYVPAIRKDHVTPWSPIVSAIENLGSDHDFLRRLATMLIQSSKLPAALDDNGNQLTANSGRKVWHDIPDFSFIFFQEGVRKSIKPTQYCIFHLPIAKLSHPANPHAVCGTMDRHY